MIMRLPIWLSRNSLFQSMYEVLIKVSTNLLKLQLMAMYNGGISLLTNQDFDWTLTIGRSRNLDVEWCANMSCCPKF